MKTITVRLYEDGDEKGILSLFGETFGREMSLNEWRWKYQGQGNEKVYSTVVTTEGNRIVGHYGGIPLPAIYKGQEIKLLLICDVMIHSKFRGIKTLKKITTFHRDEALKIGFSMCLGFPTENTLMLPAEKLGIIERAVTVRGAIKETAPHKNINRFLYRLFPLSFEDSRIDELWKRVKANLTFSSVRDRRYFLWRYKNHPRYHYACWGLNKFGVRGLMGMAVTKKDPSERVLMMDMLFLPDTLAPLLQKVEDLAYYSGKKEIALFLPENWSSLLRGMGFTLHEFGAIARDTNNALMDKKEMAAHFFYTLGDTDYL